MEGYYVGTSYKCTSQKRKAEEICTSNFFHRARQHKASSQTIKKRLIVLEHLASQLNAAKMYTEKEINEFIKPLNEDYATIRRELFIHKFVNRNNDIYEVNEPEEWRDWKTLI